MNDENTKELLYEIRSLIQVVHDDRAAQKVKEAGERWTRYVSLWVVMLAVVGALASQQQTSFSGRSVRELNTAAIEQGLASNTWSYYQSVSIKGHLYTLEDKRRDKEKPKLESKPEARPEGAAVASPDSTKRLIDEKQQKYERQKRDILEKGRAHDGQRDVHRKRADEDAKQSRALGLAMAILQVAVALASISILAKRKSLFATSVVAGVLACAQAVNGYFAWYV